MQPSTSHLLDGLGLLEYVLAQPRSILEAGKVKWNGRPMGELAFKRIAPEYPYAIWMPRPIYLAAMHRKAAEPFPSFRCWMGAKVSKLSQENGVTLGVTGLRHGKEPFEVIQAGSVLPTGVANPSAATSSPPSFSSLLKRFMNPICALRSSSGHVETSQSPAWRFAFIISMYFMSNSSCSPRPHRRVHG
jgi:hypothetical protein